ncbi:AraC family transcriptional regulator [Schleiferilactobacillus harbinensis]|jgi:AraC-like DNA-binding protein|uniref:AraC family transcriptional regulator n=1 Tax=Schleiferilactobacillus harbinensis TaxID=304207 RepID=UPI002431B392|nr:AraC family transcriptional regulator [Schleiferilactobacillus harbinensis]MCI1686509.1 AraC family transcriptional regulator [Schleiferilactobacillus harbinensis]MCI1782820.1 AraC family transcriptional regulator [Schleiferilactobacillus harbinensis]MCI1850805.1 AraC family transcriptional regulator [Schleiferilactobacillus harbinensis]
MEFEYKRVDIEHVDCNVVFYGREQTRPNYAFGGNNVRDSYVLHYIVSGKGRFASAGRKSVALGAGDCFLLPQSVPCFYQADGEDPWAYEWIGLTGMHLGELFDRSGLADKYWLRHVDGSAFQEQFAALFQGLHSGRAATLANELQVQSQLYAMFYALLTEFPGKGAQERVRATATMNQAVAFMRQNYPRRCNVTDVCTALHVSRTYLYTLFRRFVGMSPQQYLTQMRMDEAKQLLRTTDNAVDEVAARVGYKDAFTFSKAFKRAVGASPREYRQ